MRTGIVSNSTICLPLLHYLRSAGKDLVVFSAELAVNEKGTVASFCADAGISCMHEKSSCQSLYDWVNEQRPEIIFVIGYNEIIRIKRFNTFMPVLYNVHFGHLPEYRGPNPVFWQLKNGSPSLAITIHYINERLDAGAIAWEKEYPNEPFFSYGYVHQLMSHYLVEGVDRLLELHRQKHAVAVKVQDEQQAGYFSRPVEKDVSVSWTTMNAVDICNLVKACNPWNNGAITSYNGFEVRIVDAEPALSNGFVPHAPGTILDTSTNFLISCINNEVLHIHTLMVNGVLMPGRFAAKYGFLMGQSFHNF
jgi:methionyl-tRNA formyltransferase